jgi:energy-coupling factor transporter ATP-binding protein EcfA2
MSSEAGDISVAARLSAAFDHSITWEDDLWHADPVDVEAVHRRARRKFFELLDAVTTSGGTSTQGRMLLFHGQSGAGKTHLLRALRTASHRAGKAYFGYAQMTPDVASYADYYLRRLINSLEKPYDPINGGESALTRLTNKLVADSAVLPIEDLNELREAELDETTLARFVLQLADDIVASPRFAPHELDVNIVRALLYLQRSDPRVDQRVRQYLYGRPLNDMSQSAVAALDSNSGEGRAFEIIEALGKLAWVVDGAALVFAIDQVEDLRFFDDADERFQKAVRDLIQIANRIPTAIILISCLGDFYDQVRGVLAQSYVDRIEKAGPVALLESRTPDEARLIVGKRLEIEALRAGDPSLADVNRLLGAGFFEELGGLSTRRLLEQAQNRVKERLGGDVADLDAAPAMNAAPADSGAGFISTLAAALGLGLAAPEPGASLSLAEEIDFRAYWERFQSQSEAEIPTDDHELSRILVDALTLARDEAGGAVKFTIGRVVLGDDLPAFDLTVAHASGSVREARVFICNRSTQGGGLKRQLDRVLLAMNGRSCWLLRSSDFPPNRRNQTAQALRKFREEGGHALVVPIPDWERMITVREYHRQHRSDNGFAIWFEHAKLLSHMGPITELLGLSERLPTAAPKSQAVTVMPPSRDAMPTDGAVDARFEPVARPAIAAMPPAAVPANALADWTGWGGASPVPFAAPVPVTLPPSSNDDDDLPLSVILDENGSRNSSIVAGREIGGRSGSITLNKDVLRRHAAVLGGSGSGKTTLALTLIEQLLLRGIPAVLIDRKGDLCSYANPDVWRANDNEYNERRGEREKLADSIDVAVYTPGRASGRPISITLLPTGINELPEHEQQLLANLSAAALGDMLHLKNSATHQKQSGTLSVALRILGSRFSKEVTLGDLINLLEEEDPELGELTQRMDPSGKIRRDLIGQLDSLRHRNSVLFEGGGESLRMDALLGLGPYARRDGRTRLSIIYTGFLGDNENVLFWVSQFLSEALRFCQRNPNEELQAVVMLDEADLYIPANAKPATAEPLQSLLKRARSAGLGMMLATQSPGDLDYKSRDQITSWFIGRVREDTALRKLKAAFQSESGLDPAAVLPHQTVGEFHLVQEGLVRAMKAQRSLIEAEQVPFDRIEQLAFETKGQDEKQLRLFA